MPFDLNKILLRIFIFGLGMVGLNETYRYFFFEADLKRHSPEIEQIRSAADAEIIYLGESSDITMSLHDLDKRPVSSMVADYFPRMRLASINRDASHAEVYRIWLQNIPENSMVGSVIVTVNLRSFGPLWIYSYLENAVQKNLVLLRDRPALYSRTLLSLRAYGPLPESGRNRQVSEFWKDNALPFEPEPGIRHVDEWERLLREKEDENRDSVNLAVEFVKAYAFLIDPSTNPRIRDLDRICELAKQRGWNLIFNLLSENVLRASHFAGPSLARMIRMNRDLLVTRYSGPGVQLVDNLEAVDPSHFTDKTWVTEHYDESGRKTIASNLGGILREIYPSQYSVPPSRAEFLTLFFQDNDTSDSWGRYALSSERAHSGTYSCKTGRGDLYSTTFAYPLKNIADSCKNYVDVSFFVYRRHRDLEAFIAVIDQCSGSEDRVPLNDMTSLTDKWEPVTHRYQIKPGCRNAPLIRIFIYNPTHSITYVDDIRIEFH